MNKKLGRGLDALIPKTPEHSSGEPGPRTDSRVPNQVPSHQLPTWHDSRSAEQHPEPTASGDGSPASLSASTQAPPGYDVSSRDLIHRLDPRVIGRNPQQPRQDFDEAAITELADSIRVNGILQPLVVRVNQAGEYELVAGERRLRAAQHLEMAEVPAVVRDVEDSGLLELALIENIQRENLNSIEEAQAFHELREIHGWTQEQLAERLGKKRSTIANTLRLLDLPIAMQVSLRNGKIAPGHAKVLLSVTDPAMQGELHRLVLEQAVSVRELERLSHTQPQDDSPKSDRATRSTDASAHTGIMVKGPHLAEEEELWSRSLGTKVEIREGRGRGKIVLHFFSTDDYQRLKDRLTD